MLAGGLVARGLGQVLARGLVGRGLGQVQVQVQAGVTRAGRVLAGSPVGDQQGRC